MTRPRPASDRLWAGMQCPNLPLAAVWNLVAGDRPRAVHDSVRGRAVIVQAEPRALSAGVRPGQPLAAALAILPELHSRTRNPGAERQALERMALVAYGHSDRVALAPPDTVLLEIAGSQRLRRGLGPLLETLKAQLAARGFAVRLGSAPVPAAARLLARLGRHVRDRAGLERLLGQLPLEALELDAGQLGALRSCGLKTAGGLFGLPAAERARRVGPALNRHLEEIRGDRITPLAGWRPAEEFRLKLELPVATASTGALTFALNRGLEDLGCWLAIRDRALTRLRIRLTREDSGPPTDVAIGLARPGFDRGRLLELIRLKLEPMRLPASVTAFELLAETTDQHRPPQADLYNGANRNDAWPALLDRLGARLGEDAVRGLASRPDHRPEKAWCWVRPGMHTPCTDSRPRPTWLLPEPRPCRIEDLELADGPERIESGWWDGEDCRRDYWTARDRHGRKIWVFREYKPRQGWFIHGMFE